MTGHDRFLELAASAIDFELSADESTALQRHLAGCEVCRPRIAQIRGDARAIAALPLLRAGWSVPALTLNSPSTGLTSASLRLIAMAALALALAIGIVAVGTEVIRRQNLVTPTVTTEPSPTAAASATAPSLPAPTTGPSPTAAGQWLIESLDAADLPFGIAAVAASGSRLVAVGWRTCIPVSEPTECWANVFTSDDGGTSWAAAPRSDALRVGFGGIGSGPEPGMLDVAGRPGGFLAIGYDELFRAAAWRSIDGRAWTKSASDPMWDQARVRAVTATSTGWVIGGEVFLDSGPRAAIWSSPDGATWTRAPDGPTFDIGGYLQTGEEPGSGGIADVTSQGSITFAVGSTCDANGLGCMTSAWVSSGGAWSRSNKPGGIGKVRTVAPFGQDLIAAGYRCTISDACPGEGRTAVVMTSADRASWTEFEIPGTTGTLGIRALGASAGYLVGVVEGVEGVDGVDAHQTGELILVGSVDGDTWEVLGDVPQPGVSDMRDVGITTTPDGAILIVGWGQVPTPDGFTSFVVRVTRTPS